MSGSNALQITDPNASDNALSQAPSWADAYGSVSGAIGSGVDRLGQWLSEQRAKSGQRAPVWSMSNPVGTETTQRPQELTVPTPGVQPVAFWGGQPVSQQFYDQTHGAMGTALGFVGTFGGPAAKTADLAKLSLAQRLETQGIGRDDIWSQTGWYKGPEGNWRFEIPDTGMKVTGPISAEGSTLGSVVEHPELYAAYPQLRQTEMYASPQLGGGSFSPAIGDAPPAISIGANKNPQGVMLHEIQHNIQQVEGNVQGASPMSVASGSRPDLRDAFLQEYRRLATNITTPMSYEDYAKAAWGGEMSPASQADYLNNYLKTVPKSVPLYSDLDRTIQSTAATSVYRRVFGEVEARSVPKRLGMTPEARSAVGPWFDWDVPESDFILPRGYGQ